MTETEPQDIDLNTAYPPDLLDLSSSDREAIKDGTFDQNKWLGVLKLEPPLRPVAGLIGEIVSHAIATGKWESIPAPDRPTTGIDASNILARLGYVRRAPGEEAPVLIPTEKLARSLEKPIGFRRPPQPPQT